MIFNQPNANINPLRAALLSAYRADETTCLKNLINLAAVTPEQNQRIRAQADLLVRKVRADMAKQGGVDAILRQYDLSSDEGIALMCIAEALLRIPDPHTVDKLLADKLISADWSAHLGKSDSLFVNAVTWSLMITGKIYTPAQTAGLASVLKRITKSSSAVAIRPAVKKFMQFLGRKFVMGETIEAALKRAANVEPYGYRYSYDMLGEGAKTDHDAGRYHQAYVAAIHAIGQYANNKGPIHGPGISIKLSALHPRYEWSHRQDVMRELVPRVTELMLTAKQYNIAVTIDAEEAARLDLSLDVVEAVLANTDFGDWQGIGLAVQAYQKRAPTVLDCLADLARKYQRRLMIRLVKGAYWDYEIKNSQELGLENYPVFTRKNATDVSYLACARKMLNNLDVFYPQFATHNAYSIAAILDMAQGAAFEFQCLHGMGQKVYDHIVGEKNLSIPCRIYAPVGSHQDLLGYLMRRLLENGANTSFINLITNQAISLDELLRDPIERLRSLDCTPHPHIPLPRHIYGASRLNAKGMDLSNQFTLNTLDKTMEKADSQEWLAEPMISSHQSSSDWHSVMSPSDTTKRVGKARFATEQEVDLAFQAATQAFEAWNATPVNERAACLEKMADLLEVNMENFMMLACTEAGKSVSNAVGEVREAIDFCRYYADMAKKTLKPIALPGPTGESNELHMHGRGVIVCISPWNFPLAIFLGQVSAALVTGNCVLAKPAEQTPLIAAYAVTLLHQAGVPAAVLQLLPGTGEVVGRRLVADKRTAGVMFTGSTETAKSINQVLSAKDGPIVPLIAETGGMNAMIVDSSALPEQVVVDVLSSAFDSAGQRCSALRILFVQDDIAEKIITMLTGAMQRLVVDQPWVLSTDVGPVIDDEALKTLQAHQAAMQHQATLLYQVPLAESLSKGYYFAPCVFELKDLSQLKREVFGPILHIIRYAANDIDNVVDQINNTGFGLTLGIHSRIKQFANDIIVKAKVGNIYVNRNIIGAVVGVQPFGGEGLSGTGPKAGGPHYLYRLCTERTVTINTTAAGGNASLLMLEE